MAPQLIHIPPTNARTSDGSVEDSPTAARALRQSIIDALRRESGQKSLPTDLLYDEKGLELYDDITTNAGHHYYLFPAEESILKTHASDIIRVMCSADDNTNNGVLLELGSGSLRKTSHLISALSNKVSETAASKQGLSYGSYSYYALDLAPKSLIQSLHSLEPIVQGNITVQGLVTDYESGLQWVRDGGLDRELETGRGEIDTSIDQVSEPRGRSQRFAPLSSRSDSPCLPATPAGDDHERYIIRGDDGGLARLVIKTADNITDFSGNGERGVHVHHHHHHHTILPPTPPYSYNYKSRDPSASGSISRYSSSEDSSFDYSFLSARTRSTSDDGEAEQEIPDDRDSRDATLRDLGEYHFHHAEPEHDHNTAPLHILFLGSSLGNFSRASGASFLRSLPLRPGTGDTLLLGLDHRNEKSMVERAYNDPEGWTAKFILNGLTALEKGLGARVSGNIEPGILEKCFEYVGVYNEDVGRHEAYYRAKEDTAVTIPAVGGDEEGETITFQKGELVNIEYSYKYSDADAYALFAQSNLRPIARWQHYDDSPNPTGIYSLWLLERPSFSFPLAIHPDVTRETMEEFGSQKEDGPPNSLFDLDSFGSVDRWKPLLPTDNPFGAPTLADFREMWKAWDEITLGMIPREMHFVKPIDLRHVCIFYIGHIPAFLDIQLSRLLGEPHTEPEYFKDIFERGIDPHVDDPSQIHPHSEVPTSPQDWPSLDSILSFRDRVRERVVRLYEALERGDEYVVKLGRRVHRVLWMCLEHDGWHAETLLYMLIQRAGTPFGTKPPSGFAPPVWKTLPPPFEQALPKPSESFITLPPQTFSIGHDDFEGDDLTGIPGVGALPAAGDYEFGWDNEHPKRIVAIDRTIKVSTRCVSNAEYAVFLSEERKNGNGSSTATIRPIPASWVMDGDDIKVRTLYGPVDLSIAGDWPLVSSYDDLAAYASWKGGRLPNEVELRAFMDQYLGAENSNLGFREWSFTAPLEPQPEQNKRGHNGGVWEWTSTVLAPHEGFEPSVIYPGYTSDFFDGLHNVVLGGSFATVSRIAQRRTVRNYYQHNYPYAWVGGRVVYDSL